MLTQASGAKPANTAFAVLCCAVLCCAVLCTYRILQDGAPPLGQAAHACHRLQAGKGSRIAYLCLITGDFQRQCFLTVQRAPTSLQNP